MTSLPLRPTKYFDDNEPVPENFPWESWTEMQADMDAVWEHMKSEGLRTGKLETTPEGFLKGSGHPDEWFDAVDMSTLKNGKA